MDASVKANSSSAITWWRPFRVFPTGGALLLVAQSLLTSACTGAVAASMGKEIIKADERPRSLPEYGCVEYSASLFNPVYRERGDGPVIDTTGPVDPFPVAPATGRKDVFPARFARVEFDGGGFWNPGQPGRVTVPFDGLYAVRVRTNFHLSASALDVGPRPHGVLFARSGRLARRDIRSDPPHASGYWPTIESNARFELKAGEFIAVRAHAPFLFSSVVDLYIRRVCD